MPFNEIASMIKSGEARPRGLTVLSKTFISIRGKRTHCNTFEASAPSTPLNEHQLETAENMAISSAQNELR